MHTYLVLPPASRKAPSALKAREVKHCPEVELPSALLSEDRRPPARSRRPSILPWGGSESATSGGVRLCTTRLAACKGCLATGVQRMQAAQGSHATEMHCGPTQGLGTSSQSYTPGHVETCSSKNREAHSWRHLPDVPPDVHVSSPTDVQTPKAGCCPTWKPVLVKSMAVVCDRSTDTVSKLTSS